MINFCADDYGVAKASNARIATCLKESVLNKVSVIPNGEITDFKQALDKSDVRLSLHINLVEGRPLSPCEEVDLLVTEQGNFKYSFIGLFLACIFGKRKKLKQQLYKEIRNQLLFWKEKVGDAPLFLDSHQHIHMIPVVFATLLKVIEDENLQIDYLRIPNEPILPYICTPSLYTSYSLKGLLKQWVLKFCALCNSRKFKKSHLDTAYFMGVMFSGRMAEDKIHKLLAHYLKLSEKHHKDIEIAFHPGYLEVGETTIDGCRKGFVEFYTSARRQNEYNELINFKL